MTGAQNAPLSVVVGLLVDEERRVLVARRPAHVPFAGWWEFPGGKRRSDESSWQALARELEEELGIRAERGRPALDYCHDYTERRVHLDVWWVDAYAGTPTAREGQQLAWLSAAELRSLKLLEADGPIVALLLESEPGRSAAPA